MRFNTEPREDMASQKLASNDLPTAQVVTEVRKTERHNNVETASLLIDGPHLPPMDRGSAAYSVLAAVTIITIMPFGVISSFGVFFQYYVLQRYEHADKAVWIGGISNGIMSLFAPMMVYACLKLTPRLPLFYYIAFGWLLCLVGLLASAVCRSIALLILTQGVLLGFGALFLGYPSLMIINSWFIKRRGFAYGICFASAKLISIGLGFLVDYLLHVRGRKTTFFVVSALVGAVPLAALPFIRERGTDSLLQRTPATVNVTPVVNKTRVASSSSATSLIRPYYGQPLFYFLCMACLLESVGYAIPKFYISTYSADILGLPTYTGPLLLGLYNATGVVAKPLFGYLSDLSAPQFLMVLTTTVCAISTTVLWGISSFLTTTSARLGMLATFMIIFGLAGQGFSALFSRISLCFRQYSSETDTAVTTTNGTGYTTANEKTGIEVSVHKQETHRRDDSPIVFAWINVARGIAFIVSAPISEVLLNPANDSEVGTYGLVRSRAFAGGPGWRGLIVFSAGIMLLATFTSIFAWMLDKARPQTTLYRNKEAQVPEAA